MDISLPYSRLSWHMAAKLSSPLRLVFSLLGIWYLARLSTSATRGLFTSLSRELELTKSRVYHSDTMLSYLCMLGEMFTSISHSFRSQSSRTSKPKSSKQEYLIKMIKIIKFMIYLRYLFLAFSSNIEVIGFSPLIIV